MSIDSAEDSANAFFSNCSACDLSHYNNAHIHIMRGFQLLSSTFLAQEW